MVTRSVRLAVVGVAVVALGLTACSEQTPGDASAGADPTTGTTTESDVPTTGGTTTESTGQGGGVTELDPCALLDPSEQQDLRLEGGTPEEIAGAAVCAWTAPRSGSVRVYLWSDLGIDDVQSRTEVEPLTIGGRDAVRGTAELDVCLIALAVTDNSRVDVHAAAGSDVAAGCALAEPVAEVVEAKLP